MKKTIIAMILVGGKGTRLKEITKDTAKPAVSFGAKYKLIDFTLSNLSNSNIDVVGLVTQYEPFELMSYIGRGRSWDLDVLDGGVFFLTPFAKNGSVLWQKGTVDAVRHYADFVREYQASYLLILSGDQIYKMDYQDMLRHHLQHNAMVTIAATPVDPAEAHRFGIMETDSESLVKGFEEKPEHPKSNLASMGIYIFNTDVLEKLLRSSDTAETIDFGADVIPRSLASGDRVAAYRFEGYWRDLGTVESLYSANMDLLDDPDFLGLNQSKDLPVYSKSLNLPPHVVLETGNVQNSVIADGCIIGGTVRHSTVGYRTIIRPGAEIKDCVIFPGVMIRENVRLEKVVVNKNLVIPKGYRLISDHVVVLDSTNLESLGEKHE
ncbi:MAG TPA: sugar phosphate nucleotidyltransferase [Candidatus Izemoplasmatales bacterium]|nr:sugar phosphate nucleotidyltransferase [Candidatus Izemoplasmatales bacterium]